ncbi:MAG TPA: winged helix-turn-helix domain-containing protein [Steroidobacteraceae bacterium]
MTSSHIDEFDGLRVNRKTGEVAVAGKVIRLSPQYARVLLELTDNAGAVVSRERLAKLLWPRGNTESEDRLNAIVRELQTALGDQADSPRYIETVPHSGFRFIGALADTPTVEAPALRLRNSRRWMWWLAALPLLAVIGWWLYQRVDRSPGSQSDMASADLEAALREEPDDAESWAALSTALIAAALAQLEPPGPYLDRARDAAERAVKLDETLAAAHAALGKVHTLYTRDLAKADDELARAIELDERLPEAWEGIGILRAFQGRADDALAAMSRARELDPHSLRLVSRYGLLLFHARRYDAALSHLLPLVTAHPDLVEARSVLIRALIAKGRFDEALAQSKLRTTDIPNLSDLALLYSKIGRREDALAEAQRIEARGYHGFSTSYETAVIYASLDELDKACAAIAQAAEEHSTSVGWARLDPRLDPLRGKSCFAVIEPRI